MSTHHLARAFSMTRGILAEVAPDQLGDPTPCASWKVRDLVNHICEGANWFGLCVEAGHAPDPDPTHGVDYAAGDVLGAYDTGVARSLAAFGAAGDQPVDLPFGTMPASVFMVIATTDVFTHGWDLAEATGQSAELDHDLASELLPQIQDLLTDELRGADGQAPFGPKVEPPDGASPAEQLVAFLGRNV